MLPLNTSLSSPISLENQTSQGILAVFDFSLEWQHFQNSVSENYCINLCVEN